MELQLAATEKNSQTIAALFCQAVLMNTGIQKIRYCVCQPKIDSHFSSSIFIFTKKCVFFLVSWLIFVHRRVVKLILLDFLLSTFTIKTRVQCVSFRSIGAVSPVLIHSLQNTASRLEVLSARELDTAVALLLACESCSLVRSHLQVVASSNGLFCLLLPWYYSGLLKGIFTCTVPP